jgi:hypothetical protein
LTWAAFLALGLATETVAQGASPTLDGVYVLDAKASESIEKAIDLAVADMGFVKRSFARGILKKRHPAYSQIQISHDATEIVVTLAQGNPMRMPMDGAFTKWKREDGDTLEINGQWRTMELTQTIDTFADDLKTKDTQRVNDFYLDSSGNVMTLNVRFTAEGLGKPILYRLVYRRRETK